MERRSAIDILKEEFGIVTKGELEDAIKRIGCIDISPFVSDPGKTKNNRNRLSSKNLEKIKTFF